MKGRRTTEDKGERTAMGLSEWLAITVVFVMVYILVDRLVSVLSWMTQLLLFGCCLAVLVTTGYFRKKRAV